MNHIKFSLLAALAVLAFSGMCCYDGDSPTQALTTQTLNGTSWKLVGIMDTQTGSLTELEPTGCKECYTLTFDTDTTFLSSSSVKNSLCGTYTYNYKMHSFRIIEYESLLFLEGEDGVLWKSILLTVNAFTLLENELRLYYNENKNYLLFKSQYENSNNSVAQISFTEYSLVGTSCLWRVDRSGEEKIIVINSYEELNNHITCTEDGHYPNVDFSKNSILLASGGTFQGIQTIETHLQRISVDEYVLIVKITLDDTMVAPLWAVALLTSKLSEESNIILNTKIMLGEEEL
jgi:hypothetical protein